ncbi:hypothetical protein C8Q79DRAFT_1009712 [Trametes meyenii]|nr:hypothetical protein C8Q79DRAFT_1009712 [Trametes meyenii]
MSDALAVELIEILPELIVEQRAIAGTIVLIFYEFVITFEREVVLFWNQELSRTTALFLLNRYISLLKYPFTLAVFNFVHALQTSRVMIVSRSCAILGDFVVVVVTWVKTFQSWREASAAHLRTSLSGMVLRDGSVYFTVLLTLNVLHIVLDLTTEYNFVLSAFEEPVTSIIIARLMINLREADRSVYTTDAGDLPSLQFEESCSRRAQGPEA